MNEKTKTLIKKIAICVVLIAIIFSIQGHTFAGIVDPLDDPERYNPANGSAVANGKFTELGGVILSGIRVIGTFLSVIMLMALGIKYMLGSASEKANYKQNMIPYIVGAIMLFAIPNILQVVYDLVIQIKT